jgi:hypothetical protein
VAEPPPERGDPPAAVAVPDVSPPALSARNRPVKSIAVPAGDGVRIEASIWPREIIVAGKPVTVYSATVRKTYRGEDGEFRHTTSFRGSELHLVGYVLDAASRWILDQRREDDPPF